MERQLFQYLIVTCSPPKPAAMCKRHLAAKSYDAGIFYSINQKKIAMKNLLIALLSLFTGNAVIAQTAPSHLKFVGFYLVNTGVDDPTDGIAKTNYTDEVGYWTNLNQSLAYSPSQNITPDVNSMNAQCTKPFMACEQIFWHRVDGNAPSGNNYDLYPDWQARWNTFKATNGGSLTATKIGCFYIADEPVWNGIPFNELDAVAQTIKNDYPTIPVFYVEAYNQLNSMQIPVSVDWVGFDQYDIFSPSTNSQYLSYLSVLKSKRSNNQKIVIIGDTHWIPLYGTQGVSAGDMGATIQSYYDLAAGDPDVIGFIGYLWPGGFDEPGELGGRNLPAAVVNKLVSIGQSIKANYSPCNADTQAPTVPAGLTVSAVTKTSCRLSWTAASDNAGANPGYEVYKNGVYLGGTYNTFMNITGLSCGTSYNFTVNAFDGAQPANISAATAPRNVSTQVCDNIPPSSPTGLQVSSITKTSFNLFWAPSADNVGVTGYEIFKNGVYYGATTGTSLSVTGLNCNTSYTMTVDAFDGASPPHNISAQSSGKNVTTAGCAARMANPLLQVRTGKTGGGIEFGSDGIQLANKLVIYPNPASSYITLSGLANGSVISIINTEGKIVYTNSTNNTRHSINLSKFRPGLYLIRVVVNGVVHSSKLVKE
jgi:chitodextrinase